MREESRFAEERADRNRMQEEEREAKAKTVIGALHMRVLGRGEGGSLEGGLGWGSVGGCGLTASGDELRGSKTSRRRRCWRAAAHHQTDNI